MFCWNFLFVTRKFFFETEIWYFFEIFAHFTLTFVFHICGFTTFTTEKVRSSNVSSLIDPTISNISHDLHPSSFETYKLRKFWNTIHQFTEEPLSSSYISSDPKKFNHYEEEIIIFNPASKFFSVALSCIAKLLRYSHDSCDINTCKNLLKSQTSLDFVLSLGVCNLIWLFWWFA